MFTTKILPSKYAVSIKFDAKRLGEKLCLRPEGWRIGINYNIAMLKQKKKRNRKFDSFSERSFFISLMDTKSGIFTRGFVTRENTAFVVHSVK